MDCEDAILTDAELIEFENLLELILKQQTLDEKLKDQLQIYFLKMKNRLFLSEQNLWDKIQPYLLNWKSTPNLPTDS
jgi:hypothetical protein